MLPFLALGFIGGAVAIAIMWLVTLMESLYTRLKVPPFVRPTIGGIAVGGIALITPQVMSSGHGALHIQLTQDVAIDHVVA